MDPRSRLSLILLLVAGMVICLGHQLLLPLLTPAPAVTAEVEALIASTAPRATAGPGQPTDPSSASGPAASPSAGLEAMTPITLTVVYDNRALDPGLRSGWGFACLVETAQGTLLFDTGADGAALVYNLEALGFDLQQIRAVVLSHNHADHTGGLEALLGLRDDLMIYVPESFAPEIARRVGRRAQVVAVGLAQEVLAGVWTLGEMGTSIPEQSLLIETESGLVLLTGCAHPGIVSIAERARQRGPIDLVLGGFHLRDSTTDQIADIIRRLQELGVGRVGPGHCTGDTAIEMFRAAYGDGYLAVHVGTRVDLER